MKHALRLLARSPGFTATAILTLALGIGACTAMFSIVRAVLWKPLPFHEPGRLVWIENDRGSSLSARTSRVDTLLAWREQAKSFSAVAAYDAFSDMNRASLTGSGEPAQLRGVAISDNFLSTLGVPLLHGRNFTAEECADNGTLAVILAHSFWQRHFAGDPAVIGRALTLNGHSVTVVGILPRTFDFQAIFSPGTEVDLFTAYPLTPATARRGNTVFGLARLRLGVTVDQAAAELAVINAALRAAEPGRYPFGALVQPLDAAVRGKFQSAFLLLGGAVLCVLAIACVNLSNLLLARLNARRQEFAVRIALGARRRDLVRQTLSESLTLAFAGSVLAVPLALWATDGLAQLRTFGVPLLQDAAVDPVALGVCIGLTTLAGLACGVLPALQLSHHHRQPLLQHASHQRTAGRSASWARSALVVAEVALACMLLVGAGLLFRSFRSVMDIDLGFQPENTVAWRINPKRNFESGTAADTYFGDLTRRLAALPGVQAVGITDSLPLRAGRMWGAGAKGVTYTQETFPLVMPHLVDRGYFSTLRIPVRAGRTFDTQDTATGERVAIINETFARRLWPDRDAVGEYLNNSGRDIRVIGVVADVRHGAIEDAASNEMYLPLYQVGDWMGLELVVRGTLPTAALVREVRGALASHDPGLPTGEFYEIGALVDDAVAPRRLTTQLLGFFSTLALALAALGLYGVISYSVGQRTQEIGIRMAIGAQRRDVLALILRGGLRLVVLGIGLGLLGSVALTRVLQSQLHGIGTHDPATFAGIAALLFAAATVACLLPALRATRVNPMAALRAE